MDVIHRFNDIEFVWDPKKAAANLRKHGMVFETACEVFFDPFVSFVGTDVVGSERREVVIGMTADWRCLHIRQEHYPDHLRTSGHQSGAQDL